MATIMMNENIREKVEAKILSQIESLDKFTPGSEEYKGVVEAVNKWYKVVIEDTQAEGEYNERIANREDATRLKEMEIKIREKDVEIREKEVEVREKERKDMAEFKNKDAEIREKEAELHEREVELREKELEIDSQNKSKEEKREIAKIIVNATLATAALTAQTILVKDGFQFEENGVFRSTTMRNLFGSLFKGKKLG